MKAAISFIFTKIKKLDKLLLLLCVILSLFSVYLLYTMHENGVNASAVTSRTWKMQLAAAGVGTGAAVVVSMIDYRLISRLWFVYTPVAIGLSLLLFTSMVRYTPGSTERNWLDLGIIQIQPSEFMTVAFIMTFATHLNKVGNKLNHPLNIALLCVHAMIPVGLMVLQGNTGGPVLLVLVIVLMLFMAGISWKYTVPAAILTPVLALGFWEFFAKEYHKMRILVIFDETLQQQEIRRYFFQQYRSLVAMSSGGLTGQGLRGGEYTSFFAIHNDFIFAYVGMTLGLVGCVSVLLVMLILCIRLLSVMCAAKDVLGRAICSGVFAVFFFQTVINVGMATVLTPVVGVPLPFVSSGGSSTLSLYLAIGLVLSVWGHREKKRHMFYEED